MALVFNVILMLSMAAGLAIANYAFTDRNYEKYDYLFENAPSASELSFSAFFSFYLILNSFIPLELPVIIEISKFLTTYFMQNDVTLMQVNTKFKEIDCLRVNNMNLHEELANISYVFCDKTGTLTQNELVFKKLSLVLRPGQLIKTKVFETSSDHDGGEMEQMSKDMGVYSNEDNL